MDEQLCSVCNHPFPGETLIRFDGQLFCDACLAAQTVRCRDCGERIYRCENEGTDAHPLCGDCRDDHYTTCIRCGQLLNCDDACYIDGCDDPHCSECYDIVAERAIHDYGYKPDPIFYGDGSLYLGVELEIDDAGESNSAARQLLALANDGGKRIYCKHDGSLSDGFEIVTHPMTLDYHLSEMPWGPVLCRAIELGYLSHQTSTCGLHVHVSRNTFGETEAAQDAVIGRILYFVERHWNELLAFSRRTQHQLDRWAARYGYRDRPCEMLAQAKKGCGNRYTCVNLGNADTIEFRIFRGTLKLNTLLATLQLVSRICTTAIALTDDELRALSWSRFVAGIGEAELVRYLKERRLYLSEPVDEEVEF